MKRDWNADELVEHWTLPPGEKALLANKTGPTRLGFAVLLKFFQHEGRFPLGPGRAGQGDQDDVLVPVSAVGGAAA